MLKKGEKGRRGWVGGPRTLLNATAIRDPELGSGEGAALMGSPGVGNDGGTLRGLTAWPCSLGGVSSLGQHALGTGSQSPG